MNVFEITTDAVDVSTDLDWLREVHRAANKAGMLSLASAASRRITDLDVYEGTADEEGAEPARVETPKPESPSEWLEARGKHPRGGRGLFTFTPKMWAEVFESLADDERIEFTALLEAYVAWRRARFEERRSDGDWASTNAAQALKTWCGLCADYAARVASVEAAKDAPKPWAPPDDARAIFLRHTGYHPAPLKGPIAQDFALDEIADADTARAIARDTQALAEACKGHDEKMRAWLLDWVGRLDVRADELDDNCDDVNGDDDIGPATPDGLCAKGDGKPVSPPSRVLCAAHLAGLGQKMEAIGEHFERRRATMDNDCDDTNHDGDEERPTDPKSTKEPSDGAAPSADADGDGLGNNDCDDTPNPETPVSDTITPHDPAWLKMLLEDPETKYTPSPKTITAMVAHGEEALSGRQRYLLPQLLGTQAECKDACRELDVPRHVDTGAPYENDAAVLRVALVKETYRHLFGVDADPRKSFVADFEAKLARLDAGNRLPKRGGCETFKTGWRWTHPDAKTPDPAPETAEDATSGALDSVACPLCEEDIAAQLKPGDGEQPPTIGDHPEDASWLCPASGKLLATNSDGDPEVMSAEVWHRQRREGAAAELKAWTEEDTSAQEGAEVASGIRDGGMRHQASDEERPDGDLYITDRKDIDALVEMIRPEGYAAIVDPCASGAAPYTVGEILAEAWGLPFWLFDINPRAEHVDECDFYDLERPDVEGPIIWVSNTPYDRWDTRKAEKTWIQRWAEIAKFGDLAIWLLPWDTLPTATDRRQDEIIGYAQPRWRMAFCLTPEDAEACGREGRERDDGLVQLTTTGKSHGWAMWQLGATPADRLPGPIFTGEGAITVGTLEARRLACAEAERAAWAEQVTDGVMPLESVGTIDAPDGHTLTMEQAFDLALEQAGPYAGIKAELGMPDADFDTLVAEVRHLKDMEAEHAAIAAELANLDIMGASLPEIVAYVSKSQEEAIDGRDSLLNAIGADTVDEALGRVSRWKRGESPTSQKVPGTCPDCGATTRVIIDTGPERLHQMEAHDRPEGGPCGRLTFTDPGRHSREEAKRVATLDPPTPGDYWVTVCAECEQASCWHGELMCGESKTADTKEIKASDLASKGLEHPDHYSRRKIREVTGSDPEPVTVTATTSTGSDVAAIYNDWLTPIGLPKEPARLSPEALIAQAADAAEVQGRIEWAEALREMLKPIPTPGEPEPASDAIRLMQEACEAASYEARPWLAKALRILVENGEPGARSFVNVGAERDEALQLAGRLRAQVETARTDETSWSDQVGEWRERAVAAEKRMVAAEAALTRGIPAEVVSVTTEPTTVTIRTRPPADMARKFGAQLGAFGAVRVVLVDSD